MSDDILSLVNEAVKTEANQTEATAGGGRELPPEGPCNLRFIGYVECGKHTSVIEGKPKTEEEVRLIFEVSGKNYPPRDFDGEQVPERITIKISKSLNEKAHFFKLFNRMNYEGKATHMSQLLGKPFRGRVFHGASKAKPENKYLTLKGPDGFSVAPPRVENTDPDTGETTVVDVSARIAPAISPTRLFIWNAAPELLGKMWKTLYIDGSFGEGENKRSANMLQERIIAANNFKDSPIAQLIESGGKTADLPDAEPGKAASTAADPLDDIA